MESQYIYLQPQVPHPSALLFNTLELFVTYLLQRSVPFKLVCLHINIWNMYFHIHFVSHRYFTHRHTWEDAEKDCREHSAHLSSIISATEQEFINGMYVFLLVLFGLLWCHNLHVTQLYKQKKKKTRYTNSIQREVWTCRKWKYKMK